jgi:hypothetical protein
MRFVPSVLAPRGELEAWRDWTTDQDQRKSEHELEKYLGSRQGMGYVRTQQARYNSSGHP